MLKRLLGFFLFALAAGCSGPDGSDAARSELRSRLAQIPVIDCHEHLRPLDRLRGSPVHFFTILSDSYLRADLVSAGAPPLTGEITREQGLDRLWEIYDPYLEFTRQTSYHLHLLKGFELLHGFRGPALTREHAAGLSEILDRRYADPDAWFAEAVSKSGIELMFLDKHWDPWHPGVDSRYFRPVFNISALVSVISQRERMLTSTGRNPFTMLLDRGEDPRALQSYLNSAEILLSEFSAAGAVAVKNTLAYSRGLDFSRVSRERADLLFRRDTLSEGEVKELQDFLVHWLIERSTSAGLPMQIHTGYLASNRGRLDGTNPMLLNPLLTAHPEARFVLFHGGYPWTGEATALAKMFPNVSLDLVWLPQISRVRARAALDEILDTVPWNKLFWGGDSHFIEETAGALEIARDVVADVLSERIQRGELTLEEAVTIGRGIFRDNALRYFQP